MNTSNQVAIVTGGGSGIGLAITAKFVQNNITTVIVGRDAEKLQQAKQKLGALCVPMVADLSNLDAIPNLVQEVITQFGHIDILVNNAGINMKKEFTEVTNEDFQKVIQTNLV